MTRAEIQEYVLTLLQKKYSLKEDIDLTTFNYVDSGYVDSLGLIQFIFELEEHFSIEFTDEEMTDSKFHVISNLVDIIERKLNA